MYCREVGSERKEGRGSNGVKSISDPRGEKGGGLEGGDKISPTPVRRKQCVRVDSVNANLLFRKAFSN